MTRNLMHRLVVYAGIINFVAFIAIDLFLGRDALSGKVVNGRFYLGNYGVYTEVSHAVFVYSACHAYSVLFGIAFAIGAAMFFKRHNSNGAKS